MEKYHLAGTIRLLPGVAEELVCNQSVFYVPAGLFKDVDFILGST